MVAHAVAVAPDVDDVAVVEETVDERAGHEVVAEDLAPLVERLVRSENGRGGLVAAGHELEEEHGAVATDGQVADLVDDEERGMGECLEPVTEPAPRLRFLERGNQVGERARSRRDGRAEPQRWPGSVRGVSFRRLGVLGRSRSPYAR